MKRSKSVQDALNVQRQLANVRGEIERIEGRKRFLENQANLSTINITLQTPTAISGSSSGFFYEFKKAISDGIEGALTIVLWLIRIFDCVFAIFGVDRFTGFPSVALFLEEISNQEKCEKIC